MSLTRIGNLDLCEMVAHSLVRRLRPAPIHSHGFSLVCWQIRPLGARLVAISRDETNRVGCGRWGWFLLSLVLFLYRGSCSQFGIRLLTLLPHRNISRGRDKRGAV
jgi:hypothetical protein